MSKLIKLSEKQKSQALNNIITIGHESNFKLDTLKNSITYLELHKYNEALGILNNMKNNEEYKKAININEKSSILKKLISNIENEEIKKACFILKDKKASKKLLVPIVYNYFLQVKVIERNNKKITTFIMKENKITCFGSETLDNTIFQISTEKDFITSNEILNIKDIEKISDKMIDIFFNMVFSFNEEKNVALTEKIEKIKNKIIKENEENNKKISDYLYLHF